MRDDADLVLFELAQPPLQVAANKARGAGDADLHPVFCRNANIAGSDAAHEVELVQQRGHARHVELLGVVRGVVARLLNAGLALLDVIGVVEVAAVGGMR